VLLVIGTSAEVYPAAALPMIARERGALVVEINPNPTPLSTAADYVLREAAGILLPALVDRLAGADD
jgi:NAD-dependent deacetylase